MTAITMKDILNLASNDTKIKVGVDVYGLHRYVPSSIDDLLKYAGSDLDRNISEISVNSVNELIIELEEVNK